MRDCLFIYHLSYFINKHQNNLAFILSKGGNNYAFLQNTVVALDTKYTIVGSVLISIFIIQTYSRLC